MDSVKSRQTGLEKKTSGKIPAMEISIFCSQVAMLLKSGIPLHEGLTAMAGDPDVTGGSLLACIAGYVEKTGSLYEAAAKTGAFPNYMTHMLQIGEKAGKLEEVLHSLSAYYNREDKVRSAVRSAVIHPVILIFLMAAVITLLVILVLPVFTDVLENMGFELTGPGIGLAGIGIFIGRITLLVMAVLLAVLILFLILPVMRKDRTQLLKLGRRLPFLNRFFTLTASSRLSMVLSMMLSSALELDYALEMSINIAPDETVKDKIRQCRQAMTAGASFSEALLGTGLFSGLYAQMVRTGEKAGRLDDVMEQLGVLCGERADEALSSLIAVIEPALVVLLSVVIGAIILSVMLPLIEIMSLIG